MASHTELKIPFCLFAMSNEGELFLEILPPLAWFTSGAPEHVAELTPTTGTVFPL